MIQLHGKRCSTQTELKLTESCMLELCERADEYMERMVSALTRREAQLKMDGPVDDRRIMLLDAEWIFAEDCYLELSARATAFQDHLRDLETKLHLLALDNAQLYAQIDTEMNDGLFAENVPPGK